MGMETVSVMMEMAIVLPWISEHYHLNHPPMVMVMVPLVVMVMVMVVVMVMVMVLLAVTEMAIVLPWICEHTHPNHHLSTKAPRPKSRNRCWMGRRAPPGWKRGLSCKTPFASCSRR